MADISDLEILPNEIFEYMTGFLPDEDVLQLCQTNKNISEYCDPSFWARRALSKGYIKKIDEFGDKDVWPKSRANERYLQLLSKEDCVPGSEKYTQDWEETCSFRAGQMGDLKTIKYFLKKGGDVGAAFFGAVEMGYLPIVIYLSHKYAYEVGELLDDALEEAAGEGHMKIVRYLISLGAENFSAALRRAVEAGNKKVIKYLTKKRDKQEFNAALEAGNIE